MRTAAGAATEQRRGRQTSPTPWRSSLRGCTSRRRRRRAAASLASRTTPTASSPTPPATRARWRASMPQCRAAASEEAAAAAAAREAQEVAAQRAVQEEEVVARAAACDAEEDARRTAAEGHAAGRDEATLLELTRSVAEMEGVVRAAAEEEEDSERGGLLKAEFAERSALQDMLIRRSHTNSKAASAAAVAAGGGGEGAGEEEAGPAAAPVVQMRVVADAAQVRASCAMNSKRVSLVHHGEIYHVVERRGNRVRLHEHGGGWLSVQGQTGNVILQLVERDADAPPIVLPEIPEPEVAPQSADNSPRASTGATSSVAQDLLPQVADIGSSMQKGFSAFGGFLGSVRLPTPGAKPK
eukprot:Rhum_TRINITY_DN14382_c13_g1::Rhum_TRINITY_DN14382_c13_g1_i1::g.85355::m.85355